MCVLCSLGDENRDSEPLELELWAPVSCVTCELCHGAGSLLVSTGRHLVLFTPEPSLQPRICFLFLHLGLSQWKWKIFNICLFNLLAGIDQYDRDSIINDFKNGTCKLLVATSVAARGLDVKHLILVVNYSCPNHYEDYVHRAGRTGRAGNKVSPYNRVCVRAQAPSVRGG
jgi:ERCC4-related helicase